MTISNSTIHHNTGLGVYITAAPVLSNNTISDNSDYGVYVGSDPPTLSNNVISNNVNYPLHISEPNFVGDDIQLTSNVFTGNMHDAFSVGGGTLTGTHTWATSLTDYDIHLRGSLTIEAGASLVLPEGAELRFPGSGHFLVYGTLTAQGTSSAPITFTANTDTPAAGFWDGLYLISGSSATLDYLTVEYAGYDDGYVWPDNTGVEIHSSDVTISNSTIHHNTGLGVYVCGAQPAIRFSEIYGNTDYGLYNCNSNTTVDAHHNWWGDASGPAPYGSGNGINYRTCWDSAHQINYICEFYVDADPWIGQQTYYGQSVSNVAYEADPVNTANGNYTCQRTDVSVPTRGLPLGFTRAYNSMWPADGTLGYGWYHTWMVTAEENGDTVSITYGDGRQIRFTWDESAYVPTAGVFSTLTKPGGVFQLTEKDQTVYHFDASGRLASVEDKNGNATTLSYDGQDRLTSIAGPAGRTLTLAYSSPVSGTLLSQVTDPAGRTVQYSYNITRELTLVTDTLGYATAFSYDENHRLLSITDANAHTFLSNEYNEFGRVVKQWDGDGNLTTFAYDEPNHKTIVTGPLGRATTYQYDAVLRLISAQDALNQTASYAYDTDNNRTQVTDKRGNTTYYDYNGRGNVTIITDTLGYTRTYTYDDQNNPTSGTDPLGHTSVYTYDLAGNLITSADPLGYITTWAYDAYGQVVNQTDALDHTTLYAHDTHGHQSGLTDALGRTTVYVYDNVGRLLSETDAEGRTHTYTYDDANRLLSVTDPLSGITSYGYDSVGNRTSVTNPNGGATTFVYDEKDRLANTIDPLGHAITYTYDAVNNQTAATDPLGQPTAYGYDALNRRTSVADPLGNTTAYTYDPNGNRTAITDANGNTTSYTYDARNQLISVTDAEGGTVSYAYDAAGNRTTMTDANSHLTSYMYDALHRLAAVQDPLSYTVSYAYDAVGNRTGQTRADDTVISYAYDALHRLTSTNYPSGTISYSYDGVSNRTIMTDTVGVTTYTYDDLDRPTQVIAPNGTLGYRYDANGNRSTLTYPDGAVVTYTYDLSDRLMTVTDWASRVTTYAYDAADRQIGLQYPNSTQTTYAYDDAGRLLNILHTSSVSGTIAVFTYTMDAVGNRLTVEHLDGMTNYTYDDLYRLTQVGYPDGEIVSYAYDPMGNRTAMTSTVSGAVPYTYDAGDRLLSAGSLTFAWDANGNMTGKGNATYSFDGLDRLTQVVSGTTTARFTYDGDGVRVDKDVSGVITEYVQDVATNLPMVLVETTGGQNTVYLYGLSLIAQEQPNGSTRYYHADGLGSAGALSTAAGQSTATYTYDAFGALRSQIGGDGNPFTFTGEQVDQQLGLIYLRARYYDPSIARFLTRDVLLGTERRTQTLHRYIYTRNNPQNLVDPSGEFALADDLVAIGLGAGQEIVKQYISDVVYDLAHGSSVRDALLPGTEKSDWRDYAASAIVGGVMGELTLYTGPLAPVLAGSLRRGSKSALTQLFREGSINMEEVTLDASIGGIGGWIFDGRVDNFFIRAVLKSGFKLGIKEGIPNLIAPPLVYAPTGAVSSNGAASGDSVWGAPPSSGK